MPKRSVVAILIGALTIGAGTAEAQWTDPRLIGGQVGFSVAITFVGKLVVGHRSWKQALREAILQGSAAGLVAHLGYTTAGRNPKLALVGKALAQKSGLMMDHSIHGEPVFDLGLISEWALTHSFIHFRTTGGPRLEIDVVNAAVGAYFLSAEGYDLDGRRSLYSGSLVFRNLNPPLTTRGWAAPGVIWLDSPNYDDRQIFGHELIHTLQFERGAGIYDLHRSYFRFNLLSFSTAVPALMGGWPEHERRWREREADLYSGRKK